MFNCSDWPVQENITHLTEVSFAKDTNGAQQDRIVPLNPMADYN